MCKLLRPLRRRLKRPVAAARPRALPSLPIPPRALSRPHGGLGTVRTPVGRGIPRRAHCARRVRGACPGPGTITARTLCHRHSRLRLRRHGSRK